VMTAIFPAKSFMSAQSLLSVCFVSELNQRSNRLVDNARLVNQITAHERWTSRGGKD
jgi:hypothetical protein